MWPWAPDGSRDYKMVSSRYLETKKIDGISNLKKVKKQKNKTTTLVIKMTYGLN